MGRHRNPKIFQPNFSSLPFSATFSSLLIYTGVVSFLNFTIRFGQPFDLNVEKIKSLRFKFVVGFGHPMPT